MSKASKRQVFDSKIEPLMRRIFAVCKQHDITMMAAFSLDEHAGVGHVRLFGRAAEDCDAGDPVAAALKRLMTDTRDTPTLPTNN